MAFKLCSVLPDRRSLSGKSVQSEERHRGLRNQLFWSGDESNKSLERKQSEIGPPMTLLSGSRKSRRSESLRVMPINNNIDLNNTEEKKLSDINTPALLPLLPASKHLRPPILRPHSSPLRCNRRKQIYDDIDFESIISSKFKSPPESIKSQKHYSLWASCEAHFSSKPPIAPIRLIFTDPSIRNRRIRRLKKAMHQIELQAAEDILTSEKSFNKRALSPTRPLLRQGKKQQALHKIELQTAKDMRTSEKTFNERALSPTRPMIIQGKKQKNKTFRFVKSIVKDVVKNLPLIHDDPLQVTNGSKSAPIYRNNRKYEKHDLCGKSKKDSYGNFSDDYSRCSIAVQALIQQKSRSDISEMNNRGHSAQSQNDDWIGGVRALRDSHVRLVLRQLRHITCLNRALDRATKP